MPTQAAAPSGAAALLARPGTPVPVAALLEVGVLDELTAVGALVEDISRAHPVWRVRLADGRRLVVTAGIGHGGPDLAVECLVYRMTRWCGPLAAALPVPLLVDEYRRLPVVLASQGGMEVARVRVPWPAAPGRIFRVPERVLRGADPSLGPVMLRLA